MKKHIMKAAAALLICLFPFASFASGGKNDSPPPQAKEPAVTSDVNFEITEETVKFTISSLEKIYLKTEASGGKLIFGFVPPTEKSFAEAPEKGLISSFSCKNGPDSKIIINSVSIPYYEIKEKTENHVNYTVITVYANMAEGQNFRRKAIKTKNTYKSGERLLTDIAVILDSSSKRSLQKKAMKTQGILNKVLIATEKPGFRENLKIMASGKKPEAEKAGAGLSSLKGIVPIEKSESLNVSFKNKSLQEIIKYLAEKSDKNVIISPLVTGKKTIEFTDISPEEALRLLLSGTGYDYRIMRNAIIAGPPDIIEKMGGERDAFKSEEGYVKKVFVMRKKRGETVIKELKSYFPQVSYVFHSKLNAFEIYADPETAESIGEFIGSRDISDDENKNSKTEK